MSLGVLAFHSNVNAQCSTVSVEAFPLEPQSGNHNYFGVRITLTRTYDQDVTVNGYIHDEGDPNTNLPFELTVTTGNLTAETYATFYETSPAASAVVDVSSVSPCPVTEDSNFVITRNEDITDSAYNGYKITVSDVYSRLSKLKRKVEIFNTNNESIGVAYIKLESSNDQENMYDKIHTDSSHFSGILTIEVDSQTIYSITITNGEVANRQVPPVYNAGLSCTWGHVHDCVAYEIEGMNWVHYAFCLMSAPACYLEQWSSCLWEVCHQHMQYTNPN